MSAGRLPVYGESSFDDVLSCVHCGLCLDACPTYRELGTEQDSPRGRVYLMRGMWEGELSPTDDVVAPLSRCLDCRACETACPSGVPYGQLLETTRAALLQARPGGLRQRLARAFFLRTVLPSDGWRRWLSGAGWLYAALRIDRVIAGWPLRHLLPAQLVGAQAMLPAFSGRSFKATHGARTHVETPRAGVGLFTGGIMDVAERQVHASTVRLLEAAGCEVVVPREQTCCGALHVHSGERATAETLARINTRVFGAVQLDAVIVNAAGCGAQLQQYAHLVREHEEDTAQFARLAAQVVDVMEYLAGVPGLVALPEGRVGIVGGLYYVVIHE